VIGKFSEAVVAIEQNKDMAAEAEANLAADGCLNVAVVQGNLAEGAVQHAPFDVIVVQGAVEHVPGSVIAQLAEGGRIVAVFSQKGQGAVRVGYKSDGQMSWRFACNAFAPVLSGFVKERSFAL
jgi:protein-L-isoaspartate(D-aspartate) O-methyltransferase